MQSQIEVVNHVLEKYMYKDTMKVIVKEAIKVNSITKYQEVVKYENISCRLSQSTENMTTSSDGVAKANKVTQIFTTPTVTIPKGSILEVEHLGVVERYTNSSDSSRYETHQQITVEKVEKA